MQLNQTKIFGILSFLVPFIVYVATLAPSVMFTDSGELATAAVTLGVPHPTGYPLFTILTHSWTLLPLPGSEIYGLNMFAALVTAFSAIMLFAAMRQFLTLISNSLAPNAVNIISLAFSLAYAFAPVIWSQGTSIEVYCLHLLLVNSILYLVFKAFNSQETRFLYLLLAAYLLGLSFTNHLTTVLLVPSLLFIIFRSPDETWNFSAARLRKAMYLALAMLFAGTVYAFLPLLSATHPVLDWGEVSRGWDKFIYHATGKQYQVWMFTGEGLGDNLVKFFTLSAEQLLYIGIIPFLFGFKLFKRNSSLATFVLLLILVCVIYSINYSIHDIDAYFSPAFIGMFLFAAAGTLFIVEKYKEKFNANFLYLLLALPALALIVNFSNADESDNYLVEDFTGNVLRSLDSNALIISSQWDYWNSAFWYKKYVEQQRRDVTLISMELLRRTWYPRQLMRNSPEVCEPCQKEINQYGEILEKFESRLPYNPAMIQQRFEAMLNCLVDRNFGKRPVYITVEIWQKEPNVAPDYIKVPDGFALRLEKEAKQYEVSLAKIKLDRFIKSLEGSRGHLVEGIASAAALSLSNIARYAMFTGDIETARRGFELALEVKPDYPIAVQGLHQLKVSK